MTVAAIVGIDEEKLVRQAITAREQGEKSSWQEADSYAALAELPGWTQQKIAERCRTKQPRVSKFIACAGNYSVLNNRPAFWEAFSEVNSEKRQAHVANNTGDNEWYTPAEYIAAAREVLGSIDLDPASTVEANQVVGARRYYIAKDDGLRCPWHGKVWLNPPYNASLVSQFMKRLVVSYEEGNVPAAISLTNNATETDWFVGSARKASALFLPDGRIKFWHPRKEATPLQGQALLYFGPEPKRFVGAFKRFGGSEWYRA